MASMLMNFGPIKLRKCQIKFAIFVRRRIKIREGENVEKLRDTIEKVVLVFVVFTKKIEMAILTLYKKRSVNK